PVRDERLDPNGWRHRVHVSATGIDHLQEGRVGKPQSAIRGLRYDRLMQDAGARLRAVVKIKQIDRDLAVRSLEPRRPLGWGNPDKPALRIEPECPLGVADRGVDRRAWKAIVAVETIHAAVPPAVESSTRREPGAAIRIGGQAVSPDRPALGS